MHLISLFQWLCHELCNLLLCTSFTAIMSWIQNGHSCPLFCIKCYKQKKEPFLYFPILSKRIQINQNTGLQEHLQTKHRNFLHLWIIRYNKFIPHKYIQWHLKYFIKVISVSAISKVKLTLQTKSTKKKNLRV